MVTFFCVGVSVWFVLNSTIIRFKLAARLQRQRQRECDLETLAFKLRESPISACHCPQEYRPVCMCVCVCPER